MWYVMQADQGSKLQSGFNQQVDQEKYLEKLEKVELTDILNFEEVTAGDVFFIPAGRVHAIGKGILLAEIQQTSDITYRIYDYDRRDDQGNPRELHTDLALDAIDYTLFPEYKTKYESKPNESVELASCQYFTTNVLDVTAVVEKDYNKLDSFVIYICMDGELVIETESGSESIQKGETILVSCFHRKCASETNYGISKVAGGVHWIKKKKVNSHWEKNKDFKMTNNDFLFSISSFHFQMTNF